MKYMLPLLICGLIAAGCTKSDRPKRGRQLEISVTDGCQGIPNSFVAVYENGVHERFLYALLTDADGRAVIFHPDRPITLCASAEGHLAQGCVVRDQKRVVFSLESKGVCGP